MTKQEKAIAQMTIRLNQEIDVKLHCKHGAYDIHLAREAVGLCVDNLMPRDLKILADKYGYDLVHQRKGPDMAQHTPAYAKLYFAAFDADGMVKLKHVSLAEYNAAPKAGMYLDEGETSGAILDLMDKDDDCIGDKMIDVNTLAQLMGWPVKEAIQRGRQAVAQQQDGDAAFVEKLLSEQRV